MWHAIVSWTNILTGRLMLGFVNACSGHAVLTCCFLGLMLILAVALWIGEADARTAGPNLPGR